MSQPTQIFGPFLIPDNHPVVEAGWNCERCREPVKKLFKEIPYLLARCVLYTCPCGTVACWEDEKQPRDAKHWRRNIKLLRSRGAQVAIYCDF
jgi:hypothetical protein